MNILLVIDRTLPIELAPLIDQHGCILQAEGFKVDYCYAPRANRNSPLAHQQLAQNIIWPWVRKYAPNGYVQFIGDLPMPTTGISTNPDGHTDTAGDYACTAYYGCPDGRWTDERSNAGRPAKSGQVNLPGDGAFDQQQAPGPDSEVGQLCARIGWLNLSRFNSRQWLRPDLVGIDWIIHCYRRYFERNWAYRLGHWKVRTLTGHGSVDRPIGFFQELGQKLGSYHYWGRDPARAEDQAPYAVTMDYKSMDNRWTQRPPSPFSVIDLTWGSYQIDDGTKRTVEPLYNAVLAVGSMGRGWDLTKVFAPNVRLGDLWFDTLTRGQSGLTPVLYGDCTLTLPSLAATTVSGQS